MKHCGLVTAWLAYEEFIISEPIPGDLLEFSRNLYQHWAVYVGGGEVIHFSGEPQNKKNAKICRDKLSEVAGKSQLRINNEFDKKHRPHSEDEIVRRAESQIGEMLGNYNVISDNCECFAKWCRNGMYLSEQKNASRLDYAINAPFLSTSTPCWIRERRKHPNERNPNLADCVEVTDVLEYRDMVTARNERLAYVAAGGLLVFGIFFLLGSSKENKGQQKEKEREERI